MVLTLRQILWIVGVVLVVGLIGYIGYLKRDAIAARWEAVFSQDDAEGRKQEVKGAQAVNITVDATALRDSQVAQVYEAAIKAAKEAPDANQPLPDDRAVRIRAHDDSLCEQAPNLAGCAAAPAGAADQGH